MIAGLSRALMARPLDAGYVALEGGGASVAVAADGGHGGAQRAVALMCTAVGGVPLVEGPAARAWAAAVALAATVVAEVLYLLEMSSSGVWAGGAGATLLDVRVGSTGASVVTVVMLALMWSGRPALRAALDSAGSWRVAAGTGCLLAYVLAACLSTIRTPVHFTAPYVLQARAATARACRYAFPAFLHMSIHCVCARARVCLSDFPECARVGLHASPYLHAFPACSAPCD